MDTHNKEVPHYLISEVDENEQFNASQFVSRADQLIKEIRRRGKVPILGLVYLSKVKLIIVRNGEI